MVPSYHEVGEAGGCRLFRHSVLSGLLDGAAGPDTAQHGLVVEGGVHDALLARVVDIVDVALRHPHEVGAGALVVGPVAVFVVHGLAQVQRLGLYDDAAVIRGGLQIRRELFPLLSLSLRL